MRGQFLSRFLLLTVFALATASTASAAPTVEAIWHVQRFDFSYRPDSNYYSCQELIARVAAILRAVGAHPQSRVIADCGSGVHSGIRAHITVASPVEATVENVRVATAFTPGQELLAHVKKVSLPTPSDIERFPARWRRISLERAGDLRLTGNDCELIHGVASQILPNLSVRVIRKVAWCTTSMRPQLEVEALVPVTS